MILKPYYLSCLSHASYLVGDEESGIAAVVDPQRDVDAYLADAAAHGLSIRHVCLTHFHADFVSGHLELAERTGASIHLGAKAKADYAFVPARDGDVLDLGRVRLRFLETPGHTPESVSIVVDTWDLAKDAPSPHAVLTGDTLFIGDVGRPDLLASKGMTAEDLAGMLYDSLHGALLSLPDSTIVYPAHGAGSACGKNLSRDTSSTIGIQRRTNYALQPMAKERFVRLVTADQPDMPAYFGYDADLNRRRRATLDAALAREVRPLSLDAALSREAAGAVVLDTRDASEFAAGHLRDSVNVGLSGRYASWVGTLLPADRPLVLVASPGREREAALRLGRIGFDAVEGFLEGGTAAIDARPDLLRRWPRIGPADLAQALASDAPPTVVDVRGKGEWDAGHVEGSLNVPLQRLGERLADVPSDRPFVVHCQTGYRSSIAASLLARSGRLGFSDLAGGYAGWVSATAGFPAP